MMQEKFNHVRNDNYDAQNHFYTIDAYEIGKEEGKVVAIVHRTGDVYYIDQDARNSELVLDAIGDRVYTIKQELYPDDKEDKLSIWIRLGGYLTCSREQILALLEKGDELVVKALLEQGKFRLDGESYIPEKCVRDFNEYYETQFEEGDYEFQL